MGHLQFARRFAIENFLGENLGNSFRAAIRAYACTCILVHLLSLYIILVHVSGRYRVVIHVPHLYVVLVYVAGSTVLMF